MLSNRKRFWRRALWIVAALVVGGLATIAYLNLTSGRNEMRATIDHRFASRDPQFARTMDATLSAGIVSGNAIRSLVNGDEIFPAMFEAIRGARQTINFETYIYWDGEIADRLAGLLAARAREGIEVRVLLDWVGSQPMEQRLIDLMEEAGVQIDRFRPIHWYTLDRINNRTHRKLLVVDGRIGFTGGVGIADKWRGDARHPDEWRENHYRVEGPVVAQMQATFAENWREATGETLIGSRFYPPLQETGALRAQSLRSAPSRGGQDLHRSLMLAIASATDHIRIGMAYFVPDDSAIAHLLAARERGVEIDIVLPGKHIDARVVQRASRHFWGTLLEAGVRIHEYEPTMYHCKFVIVDDQWATIGSANFDERSFSLNDEANLNVYNETFAREQIALFERDVTRSRQVELEEWANRSWLERFRDWLWSFWRAQL